MKNCSLFLEQADITNITQYILDTFTKYKIEISGQSSQLTQIKMTKKYGLFRHAIFSMIFRTEKNTKNFELHIDDKTNLIPQYAAESMDMQKTLITRIQKTKSIIALFSDYGYHVFGEEILQITKAFDGLILIDDLYWLDSDNNLIGDLSGKSTAVEEKTNEPYLIPSKLYPSLQLSPLRRGFSF